MTSKPAGGADDADNTNIELTKVEVVGPSLLLLLLLLLRSSNAGGLYTPPRILHGLHGVRVISHGLSEYHSRPIWLGFLCNTPRESVRSPNI